MGSVDQGLPLAEFLKKEFYRIVIVLTLQIYELLLKLPNFGAKNTFMAYKLYFS